MPEHSRSLPGLCTDLSSALDPDLFFSDDPAEIAAAKTVCYACPVRAACRETAHQLDEFGRKVEFGVWGGESADERLGRRPVGKAVYKRSAAQQARSSEQARQRRAVRREQQLLSQPA